MAISAYSAPLATVRLKFISAVRGPQEAVIIALVIQVVLFLAQVGGRINYQVSFKSLS